MAPTPPAMSGAAIIPAGVPAPLAVDDVPPAGAATVPVQARSDAHLLELWLLGKSPHTRRAYQRVAGGFLATRGPTGLRAATLGDLQARAGTNLFKATLGHAAVATTCTPGLTTAARCTWGCDVFAAGRLQAYLRWAAGAGRVDTPVGPFTLFCRPSGGAADCVAVPDAPVSGGGGLDRVLVALREASAARGCRLRIDFVEAFAPELGPVLGSAGFTEAARDEILVCTPSTFRPAAAVSGLSFTATTAGSPLPAVREALDAHARLWDPATAESTTAAEAAAFRDGLGAGRSVSAWLKGQIVADGLLEAPRGGVAELVGIVTAAPCRRRGIGAAVTARLVEEAFALGVDLPFLIAADSAARRVYERVGFRACAVRLRYAAPAPA